MPYRNLAKRDEYVTESEQKSKRSFKKKAKSFLKDLKEWLSNSHWLIAFPICGTTLILITLVVMVLIIGIYLTLAHLLALFMPFAAALNLLILGSISLFFLMFVGWVGSVLFLD